MDRRLGFLVGGGEMGELYRSHDWTATPFGAPETWPASLRYPLSILLNTKVLGTILWGPDFRLLYNDLYAATLADRHPDALGRPLVEVWRETVEPMMADLRRVWETGEGYGDQLIELPMRRDGRWIKTWWDATVSPIRNDDGEVVGLLNMALEATEIIASQRREAGLQTERDRAMVELAEREAFLDSVLRSSTDCIKVLDLDGAVTFMSEGGMKVMEISDFNDVKGCPWPGFLQTNGPDHARKAINAAKRGEASHFEASADTYLGTPKHWSISVSPILGPDGEVVNILAVSRDHTELEAGRQQQTLLNGELAHRIKNTMSVVQAIAYQTLSKVADQDAVKAFEDRLAALSRSHDVLTGLSWSAARIDDLARAALATFDEARFDIDGPDVEIGPRATLSLSLMLHEMATNAVKYGSLSVPGGRVVLHWKVTDRDGEQKLDLSWSERGGPPAVEPTRKGFGSRIIRMGLSGSGGVEVHYGTQGLTVDASAPLYQVQEA